ncbi:ABC transporter ATP-binding protein [Allgaiera indica]|nr:ATP-binding cassette domain-containing protein [Allgaiera indica]
MVFQSYSLMPWLTVQGNVGLAVRPRQIHRADHDGGAERGVEGRKGGIKLDGFEVSGADPERAVGVERVYPDATRAERQDVVEYYLERVGLSDAMDRPAAQMSMGMQQRMGIARAFALSPKLLLLDEPFGMLDSLTRWELQDVLMVVWSRTRVTTVCVTHDVDEAILLADRVVMMTNGPRATIGNSMKVDLPRPRPRSRKALLQHPDYYAYREELIGFLADHDRHARKGARKEEAA